MPATDANDIQIVWFKRDLRVHDHRPLLAAAARGPVLPLYIVEPGIVGADDFDPSHWTFIAESLRELRERCARLGQPLIVRRGDAVGILAALCAESGARSVWAHQETSNAVAYARDRAVRAWSRACGVRLTELPQSGVVRRLASRDAWDALWAASVREPLAPVPARLAPLPGGVALGAIPTHGELGLAEDARRDALQRGGERAGRNELASFLRERGGSYHRSLSSPGTAETRCARISPHLAWGTLSLRETAQAALRARREHAEREARAMAAAPSPSPGGEPENWELALRAFQDRLAWRCHFMQKIEIAPRIERENMIRGYDGLRDEQEALSPRLRAWAEGQTGYPLVDACQRALRATGWINFRMRAMLMSFAAHHLWLHWREPSVILARYFLDYEPGIHYCQSQMQSGITGVGTVRLYNPIKQGLDQDPAGTFVRRWCPELAGVPAAFIHAPWLMPDAMQHATGCRIGLAYPAPIVEHAAAVRAARARLAEYRRRPEVQEEAEAMRLLMGSRRTAMKPHPQRIAPAPRPGERQAELAF